MRSPRGTVDLLTSASDSQTGSYSLNTKIMVSPEATFIQMGSWIMMLTEDIDSIGDANHDGEISS